MGVSLKQWQKMFDVTADLLLEHTKKNYPKLTR